MKPKPRKIRKAGPKRRKPRRVTRPLFSPEDVGRTIELPLSWLTGNEEDDAWDGKPARGTYTITSYETGSTVSIAPLGAEGDDAFVVDDIAQLKVGEKNRGVRFPQWPRWFIRGACSRHPSHLAPFIPITSP